MTKDHLDREVSASIALTESGITGKAKSRIVAAFDRLGGNVLELLNVPMEGRTERARAKVAAEKRLIEAATAAVVKELKSDPATSTRVLERLLQRPLRKQVNTDGVLFHAIEDLRREPPSDSESSAGPAELEQPFLDRFERHAEEASTEELREKWGRVLASEIRKPGTFSSKAMRLVDELESTTALLFERVCASRLDNVLPKPVVGALTFEEVKNLTTAGLLVEPGATGQARRANEVDGFWLFEFGDFALAIPCGTKLLDREPDPAAIRLQSRGAAIPVYVLTNEGAAIATILPDHRSAALATLIEKVRPHLPSTTVLQEYRRVEVKYLLVKTHLGTGEGD